MGIGTYIGSDCHVSADIGSFLHWEIESLRLLRVILIKHLLQQHLQCFSK